jgi:hypothetical protein
MKQTATMSIDRIRKLETELELTNLPADKKARFSSNLRGLEKDAIALENESISDEQRSDLEAAMKLRITMLKDMEPYLPK